MRFINTKFIADWDYIRQRKQNIIHNNNERENAKRILHTYQIGDRIMLKKYIQHKYGGPEYEGPYAITTVNDNGTVRNQWRKFHDVVNIRNIKPYYQWIVRSLIDRRLSVRALTNNLLQTVRRYGTSQCGQYRYEFT